VLLTTKRQCPMQRQCNDAMQTPMTNATPMHEQTPMHDQTPHHRKSKTMVLRRQPLLVSSCWSMTQQLLAVGCSAAWSMPLQAHAYTRDPKTHTHAITRTHSHAFTQTHTYTLFPRHTQPCKTHQAPLLLLAPLVLCCSAAAAAAAAAAAHPPLPAAYLHKNIEEENTGAQGWLPISTASTDCPPPCLPPKGKKPASVQSYIHNSNTKRA
jgi:hypothetical protein